MAETDDILVPVADSQTLRNTVAYAVREARAAAEATASRPSVHFVYPIRWRPMQGIDVVSGNATELLDKIEAWTREDLEEETRSTDETPVRIRTERIGADRYLFSSSDYAEVLTEYAMEHDIGRVILDPEYQPGGTAPLLRPLAAGLETSGLSVEEAPTKRVARRSPIAARATLQKIGLVFGLSYAFYLILAGSLDTFNLATGALVGGLSAAIFAGITAERTPKWRLLLGQTVRMLIYFPYLLWEIAKANLSVAYIILHPDLPIDPEMQEFEAAVWGDFSVTSLANSITLTPGTLTVDVRHGRLYIHTLTQNARDGLNEGGLERAVRFVFSGREAMRIPTPAERGSVKPAEPVSMNGGYESGFDQSGSETERTGSKGSEEVDSE